MKKTIILALLLATNLTIYAQQNDFALGADISGTTELEGRGVQLFNAQGQIRENTALMHELGLNAVRLRVWVNPKKGYSNMDDVLRMAQRAKYYGMDLMIDFHYSDWWADPGKQNIPDAWKNFDLNEMCDAVAQHTKATLQLLRDHHIEVRWVQIGNETTHGFLWPMGRAEENMENYAKLTEAGYRAAKSVFPNTICIVHLDAACDLSRYTFIFDGLKQFGAHWDMIGVSVYPYWDMEAKLTKSESETLEKAISNLNTLYARYGTPTMIVETGVDVRQPKQGKRFLKNLIRAAKTKTANHCKGVFYWAPELEDGHYWLGAFKNHRPTIIMDAYRDAAKK